MGRWEHLRPGWEYLPFNGGPRICLGQQYALTEAGYVTSRLCQEFSKIESRDPGPRSVYVCFDRGVGCISSLKEHHITRQITVVCLYLIRPRLGHWRHDLCSV